MKVQPILVGRRRIRPHSPHERVVIEELMDAGWTVYNRGWPDLLAERDGLVRVIEVKRPGQGGMKPRQREIARALERLTGVRVEVAFGRLGGP